MISLILSGGFGSRLWPVSRTQLPKQFAPIFEQSLFTKTVKRLSRFGSVEVCTSARLKSLTELAINSDQLKIDAVYYEPISRNTAPAIALVCQQLLSRGLGDEIVGVFPSDHMISDLDQFEKVVSLAQEIAFQEKIVTLGIKPSYPATGFGYIELDDAVLVSQESLSAYKVKSFAEKPNLETAKDYLNRGNYCWNSGIFVFQVKTMVKAFQAHMPEMWSVISKVKPDLSNLPEVYGKLPSISIDYGVMEKTNNQINIPSEIGWSDLGSWDDISSYAENQKTQSLAENIFVGSEGCFTYSDHKKTICLLGVTDLNVVETKDALLIAKKGHGQNIKSLTENIRETQPSLLDEHQFERRPWGKYENLYEAEHFKAKVITVDPLQQLSYQSHQKRSEIWVTVTGQGEVVLDDKLIEVFPGKVVRVPEGAKHRMRNTGNEILQFVEVQLGSYFGEDDIVRYEDDYERL